MAVKRHVVLVTHTRLREDGVVVREAMEQLRRAGFEISVVDDLVAPKFGRPAANKVDDDTEMVVVLGGDGTILGAAEMVYGTDVPVLGINLGHVGFLAEFESFQLSEAIGRIADRDYSLDERMLAAVRATYPDGRQSQDWALNDVTVREPGGGRMVEVSVSVDDVEMSSFSGDGVVVSTPTGSTAYAFSAGGPIIWPNVKALQLVPLAAHALFARPVIIGSGSKFTIEVLETSVTDGWICCDGRRSDELPRGTVVEVTELDNSLKLARLSGVPFTNRLVKKFDLPSVSLRTRAMQEERDKERDITQGPLVAEQQPGCTACRQRPEPAVGQTSGSDRTDAGSSHGLKEDDSDA
ncbi:NAD kinase [Bifidobacterium bombi]|uniref:NAD kinase n=1 Tax=Bifidobacterium bombi DSM 19703 TaxID=1341695 RepID=A0A080N1V0_9BIFI|nr:NAD kinase [Bifidobacterium bombi]KFF30818.1 ATP-NAD kinase [Bifidobacterium bombi DSM 19703]